MLNDAIGIGIQDNQDHNALNSTNKGTSGGGLNNPEFSGKYADINTSNITHNKQNLVSLHAAKKVPPDPIPDVPWIKEKEPVYKPIIDVSAHEVHYDERGITLCKYRYTKNDNAVRITKKKRAGELCQSPYAGRLTGDCNSHEKIVYGKSQSKEMAEKNSGLTRSKQAKERKKLKEMEEKEAKDGSLVNWLMGLSFNLKKSMAHIRETNPTGSDEGNLKYALGLWLISPGDKRVPSTLEDLASLFGKKADEVKLWLLDETVSEMVAAFQMKLKSLYTAPILTVIANLALEDKDWTV